MRLSQDSIDVTARFFYAIELLVSQRKMRGLQTFTRRYGLNYGNTFMVKQDPAHGFLKSECLVYICRDYNVNPEWLLLGSGEVFKS